MWTLICWYECGQLARSRQLGGSVITREMLSFSIILFAYNYAICRLYAYYIEKRTIGGKYQGENKKQMQEVCGGAHQIP